MTSSSDLFHRPPEPGRLRALLLSLFVHALLLAFLWIGVAWHIDVPIQTEAEIWSPQVRQTAPQVKLAPESKPAPPAPPPPPMPVVRAQTPAPVAPPPKVRAPGAEKQIPDPEIALEKAARRKQLQLEKERAETLRKEKLEDEKTRRREAEERRVQLEKERAEAVKEEKARRREAEERQKQLEKERLEALKKEKIEEEKIRRQEAEERQRQLAAEQEKKKRAEEEQRKQLQAEEERRKLEQAEKQRLAEEQKRKQEEALAQAAAERAKARRAEDMRRLTGQGSEGDAENSQGNRLDAGYAKLIGAKIKSNTIAPPLADVNGNPAVEFIIELQPDGSLRDARISRSSGIAAFDQAVKRAIERSAPFPPDANGRIPPSLILSHRLKDN